MIIIVNLFSFNDGYGQDSCSPVVRLQELVAHHPGFKQTMQLTFDYLVDLPDGSPNPWRGKSIEDLYTFLDEWFYFLPHSENGLEKIMHFSWLYYKNPHGLKLVREEPGLSWTRYFVEERGKYMDSEASLKGIAPWLEDQSLHNEEFIIPEGGYLSFNEFFTRNLKPGSRNVSRIADNSTVVSPADGLLNMINNDLRSDDMIPLKGRMSLNLDQLLGDSWYARKFIGGSALACFLLPDSYHHYHAPVTGKVVESRERVGNNLFGLADLPGLVNKGNAGYNKDFSVFEDFQHGYFIIETEQFGHVGMIPVGLQTIGSVVFEDKFNNIVGVTAKPVYKGEKLGHFEYGGSLVILLFEKGKFDAVKVLQGQQIGKLHE